MSKLVSCKVASKAQRMYMRRMSQTVAGYLLVVLCTTYLVRHARVSGWSLYVFAVLPVLPVLRMLHVVALYMQEEGDEYQRLLLVRSILLAATALLVLTTVSDFLRSYTPVGAPPPFTQFVVFWLVFGLAQGMQQRASGGSDEEPAA